LKSVFLTIKFYSLESTTVYTVGGNIRHGSCKYATEANLIKDYLDL